MPRSLLGLCVREKKRKVDKKCFTGNIGTYRMCVCVSFNVYPLLMYRGRRIYFKRVCVYIYILCEVYISFFSILFSFFFVLSLCAFAFFYIFYISHICVPLRARRDKNDRQVYLRT